MKCKYRFTVHGRIRPSANFPVHSRGWTFEFETSSAGIVTHVTVTVPLLRREEWPVVQANPAPGIKARVDPRAEHLPFIQRELRALQGLLSLLGLRSIDLKAPQLEWVPDSEQEKADLHLSWYRETTTPLPDDTVPHASFDVLARAVLASDAATDIEVPLNFYRRGMLDIYDRNYIEAIYDFYFVLETLFGAGQFKKSAVLRAFRSSDQLRSCVEDALADPSSMIIDGQSVVSQRVEEEFQRSYRPLTIDQALEKIFKLRGQLHHHAHKRRNTWHPEEQQRFECDALFLQAVASNVAFTIASPYLWDDKVIRTYKDLARRTMSEPGDVV